MTVFKAFLGILNRCKGIVIMYTVILVTFGVINMRTSEKSMGFTESKPDILLVNHVEDTGITANFTEYLKSHANFPEVGSSEDEISDALFYRDVNYIIYLPDDFREKLLAGEAPEIEVRSTSDYSANYAEMLVKKYVGTAQSYVQTMLQSGTVDENELIENVSRTLDKEVVTEVTTSLDTRKLSSTTFFFNFMNYGLLAGAIFTICTALSAFNSRDVRRRTMVSCMSVKKYNRILLLSNMLFAFVLWVVYIVLGFVLCGSEIMTSGHGLVLILNSFVFTICTVTIAFFIANLVQNKNALNGIINVIALGSSFLCGAFVQSEYLPKGVLAAAHILPSYWYIKTNDSLESVDKFDVQTLTPFFINMAVIIAFSVLFAIMSNIVSRRKR